MRLIFLTLISFFPPLTYAMYGGGYTVSEYRAIYQDFQNRLRVVEKAMGERLGADVRIYKNSIRTWDVFVPTGTSRHWLKAIVTSADGVWALRCLATENERTRTLEVVSSACRWVADSKLGRDTHPTFGEDSVTFVARRESEPPAEK